MHKMISCKDLIEKDRKLYLLPLIVSNIIMNVTQLLGIATGSDVAPQAYFQRL